MEYATSGVAPTVSKHLSTLSFNGGTPRPSTIVLVTFIVALITSSALGDVPRFIDSFKINLASSLLISSYSGGT